MPLTGAGPGAVLWSTTIPSLPHSVAPARHAPRVATGTTGHAFVFVAYRAPGGGDHWDASELHELDGAGAYLGQVGGISSVSQGGPNASFAIHGARHWIINHDFNPWGAGAIDEQRVLADNGSATALGWNSIQVPYTDLTGIGTPAGDLFLVSRGFLGKEGGLKRVSPAGATVFDKPMSTSPGFQSAWPDPLGGAYVGGQLQGPVDAGCGPIAGSGVWLAKLDPTGQCEWSRSLGTGVWAHARADGAIVGGTFTGALDLGCGPMTSSGTASYVGRLDASGACVWSLPIANPSFDLAPHPSGPAIVWGAFGGTLDLGCGAMTASSSASTFVAALDTAGACVWSRSIDAAVDAQWLPSGDVLLTAHPAAPVDFGGGPVTSGGLLDFSLARLDGATGAHLWSRSYGGPGARLAAAAAIDTDGSLLVTATLEGTVDVGAGAIVSPAFTPCSGHQDCDSYWCAFTECSKPNPLRFSMRLDENGAYRWHHLDDGAVLDACGATVAVTACDGCAGGTSGVVVERLAR